MLKKRKIAVGICAVCIAGMLTGCSIYDKADLDKMTATPGDAACVDTGAERTGDAKKDQAGSDDDQKTDDNRDNTEKNGGDLENVTKLRDYGAIPTKKYSWYIVRDKNHGMSGCDNSFPLEQYDAYYVDRFCAEKGEKVMYLTFDCGYENGYTEQMLDILKKEDVPACFFVTQTYIRDNVAIAKRMKEEGHQVGNHTIYHICMPDKSYEEIVQEVNGCADYMKEATGYAMDPYLRPPCGEYSARTLAITQDLGFKTIFWSMAYMDFDVNNQPGVDFVIDHFNKYHHSGAIILMHNVSSSNAGALEKVIANLKAEGYRFASLNELQ